MKPLGRCSLSAGSACAAGLLSLAILIVAFARHTDQSARAFDARGVPPNTLSAMAEPRFFIDNDSYAWMAHARDLMASGHWRIRHTFMDNAPAGRAMHWSHLLIWTLRGMASAIMLCTGWPAARAVELAGIWAMPLFQLLFLSTAFIALLRKLGWIPAGLFCALALTLDGLSYGFYPLRPDHHGLQLFATLFSFACLQFGGMGWVQTCAAPHPSNGSPLFRAPALPAFPEARRWFIAAGAFGGLALWLGATVWLFSLAVIALAALVVVPAFSHPAEADFRYDPALWRWWAGGGVLAGAFFYLLEYAPYHFAMRLEVNHPLYWFCWWGVAEGLRFFGGCSSVRFWKGQRPAEWLGTALALLAVVALPILIRYGPAEWHQMNNPLLRHLHAGYIDEFLSGWPAIRSRPFHFFLANMGILPVIAAAWGMALARSRNRPPPPDASLRSALAFSGLFFLLTLFQMRWGYFLAGGLLWFGIRSLPHLADFTQNRRWVVRLVCAALMVNAVAAAGTRLRREHAAAIADDIPPAWAHASLTKRIVLQWGLAAGTNQWRMAGMAADAPALYYFSGIQALASLYWENAAGWQAETDFFADDFSGEQAFSVAQTRRLTHALVPASAGFAQLYLAIKHGLAPAGAERLALAWRLAFPGTEPLPVWIQMDMPLTAIASRQYVIQTPGGLVGHSSASRVYRLAPHE